MSSPAPCNENLLIWNVRGLNSRTRRNVVRDLVTQEHVSLLTLQESKLDVCNDALVLNLLGSDFDFYALPATNTYGGIFLAWRMGHLGSLYPNFP
ncbi:hypothetical protein SETIT_4G047100v2 [Setaria italica]|uniref:Endonuclease/exonuclease/phosphatase domain-containing protein n=1 Tax=Setaria italica TaxID=4555 RepID=A0A368QQT4_SETIT|nr:hypothetical protein SETIT_4G047100v2 [Setaria italica]